MFVTFEGIDKSGKTTQAEILIKRLEDRGYNTLNLREPGGTKISEKIRDILLDKDNDEMFPVTEFLLYSASRFQLVNEIIIPALKNEKIVICDRYYDSSIAYQGYGRGINLDIINSINGLVAPIKPDFSFFIDIEVSESNRRSDSMSQIKDRVESQGDIFLDKVRRGYLSTSANEPERFIYIDGKEKPELIAEIIWEIIAKKLGISIDEKK
jgi:dTMP kinase